MIACYLIYNLRSLNVANLLINFQLITLLVYILVLVSCSPVYRVFDMQSLSVFIGPVLPRQLFDAPCLFLFLFADQIVRE